MVIIPSERNFAEKLNLLVAWRMLFTCPMILKFGEALGLELMPQLVYIDLISAQLCLHHMSFPSVLFFSARPGGDCRWLPEHSFGQKWLRLLLFLFPQFTGVGVGVGVLHHFLVLLALRKILPSYLLRWWVYPLSLWIWTSELLIHSLPKRCF